MSGFFILPVLTDIERRVIERLMINGTRMVFYDDGGWRHARFAIVVRRTAKFFMLQEVVVSVDDTLSSERVYPEWDQPIGKTFRRRIEHFRYEIFDENTVYKNKSYYQSLRHTNTMTSFYEQSELMFPGNRGLSYEQRQAVIKSLMNNGVRVVFYDQGGRNHARFAIMVRKTDKFYVFQEVMSRSVSVYADCFKRVYPEWGLPIGKTFSRRKIGYVECQIFDENLVYLNESYY
jgi:hypothetical protein